MEHQGKRKDQVEGSAFCIGAMVAIGFSVFIVYGFLFILRAILK